MSERRRAPRVPKELPVRYRMVGSVLVDDVRDISESGVYVVCAEPFPLGTTVEIALPEGRESTLTIEGRVVRVVWGGRTRGKTASPGMAIAFSSLTKTEHQRLLRVIRLG